MKIFSRVPNPADTKKRIWKEVADVSSLPDAIDWIADNRITVKIIAGTRTLVILDNGVRLYDSNNP